MADSGRLILVVGPSGAGKDTLIAALRTRFDGDATIAFPQRLITRPAVKDAEAHVPIADSQFEALINDGGAALSWRAHGHGYAIPTSVLDDLAAGRDVCVNVSRTVIPEARRRFPNLLVLAVEAQPSVLAARLAARGRETPEALADRLARAGLGIPDAPDVVRIDNSGTLSEAVDAVLRTIGGGGAGPERKPAQ